jgi:hypothetical protein
VNLLDINHGAYPRHNQPRITDNARARLRDLTSYFFFRMPSGHRSMLMADGTLLLHLNLVPETTARLEVQSSSFSEQKQERANHIQQLSLCLQEAVAEYEQLSPWSILLWVYLHL